MKLHKYSFGIGDRFAQQGHSQLGAFQKSLDNNLIIIVGEIQKFVNQLK